MTSWTTPNPSVKAPRNEMFVLWGTVPRGALRLVTNGAIWKVQRKGWLWWSDCVTGPFYAGQGRTELDERSAYELYERLVAEQSGQSKWRTVNQWWKAR